MGTETSSRALNPARIGNPNALFRAVPLAVRRRRPCSPAALAAPPARRCGPPERRGTRRSTGQRGCGWCWTDAAGWGRGGRWGCWKAQCAHGISHAKGVRDPATARTSPTRPRTTLWHEATQSNAAWRERAGAIGGGAAARCRGRSIVRITSAWGMAAIIRSAPGRHNGRSPGLARLCRRSASARFPPPTQWRKTGRHIHIEDAAEQPCPVPRRGSRLRFLAVHTLLARGGNARRPALAVRRQTAAVAHQVGMRQGH